MTEAEILEETKFVDKDGNPAKPPPLCLSTYPANKETTCEYSMNHDGWCHYDRVFPPHFPGQRDLKPLIRRFEWPHTGASCRCVSGVEGHQGVPARSPSDA